METSAPAHIPRIVRLERIDEETPSIRSFWFSDTSLHQARPGQFAMVWVPGVDEVPRTGQCRYWRKYQIAPQPAEPVLRLMLNV